MNYKFGSLWWDVIYLISLNHPSLCLGNDVQHAARRTYRRGLRVKSANEKLKALNSFILEDKTLLNHRCENLKSHVITYEFKIIFTKHFKRINHTYYSY
jgi:hypothetical protein